MIFEKFYSVVKLLTLMRERDEAIGEGPKSKVQLGAGKRRIHTIGIFKLLYQLHKLYDPNVRALKEVVVVYLNVLFRKLPRGNEKKFSIRKGYLGSRRELGSTRVQSRFNNY